MCMQVDGCLRDCMFCGNGVGVTSAECFCTREMTLRIDKGLCFRVCMRLKHTIFYVRACDTHTSVHADVCDERMCVGIHGGPLTAS